jgi:drug/metabolite transporter (DMT)-like permease
VHVGHSFKQKPPQGKFDVIGSGMGALSCAVSLAVLAWCVARGLPLAFDARPPYVLSLLYLALFGSVVAFVSYLTLIKRIGAGRSGYSAAVIPVVAMLASTLFEGYRWTAEAVAGLVLVSLGTVLTLRARERAAATV